MCDAVRVRLSYDPFCGSLLNSETSSVTPPLLNPRMLIPVPPKPVHPTRPSRQRAREVDAVPPSVIRTDATVVVCEIRGEGGEGSVGEVVRSCEGGGGGVGGGRVGDRARSCGGGGRREGDECVGRERGRDGVGLGHGGGGRVGGGRGVLVLKSDRSLTHGLRLSVGGRGEDGGVLIGKGRGLR